MHLGVMHVPTKPFFDWGVILGATPDAALHSHLSTMTARRRHDDGTSVSSLSTAVVGLPAHRRPLPTLFSTAVPFLRIFKPRTPSTGVDLHRVDELDQARSPSEMPIVEDLPGLPRLHPLASSTNASLGADGCRHYYGWMRLGCISAKIGRKLQCFGHVHRFRRGIASMGRAM